MHPLCPAPSKCGWRRLMQCAGWAATTRTSRRKTVAAPAKVRGPVATRKRPQPEPNAPPPAGGGTPMDAVEAEGRTVNEATEQALSQLGLRRDQVDIEVLTEGRPRLLGFLGEQARVRVTPRPAPVPVAPPPVAAY